MRYFDNNATTRVAAEVLEAMLPFLQDQWGNPSSAYEFGCRVREPIERARGHIGTLINADPNEIVFTGCGTESSCLAFYSATQAAPTKRHILTTEVEHPATYQYARFLKTRGYDVTFLPVNREGLIQLDAFEKSIRSDTALVSIMTANNETGVLFPIQQIAEICRTKGVLIHTDAVQAAGKIGLNMQHTPVDYLSLGGHKFYAPKGIGALYVRKDAPCLPLILGGGQELGRRAGTENVPYIVGLGTAAQLAQIGVKDQQTRVRTLRDRMEQGLLDRIPGVRINGDLINRLPNTSNLSFAEVEAEAAVLLLDKAGICASTGSACSSGSLEPSRVLTAMGMDRAPALGSIRLSLGRDNSDEDVDALLEILPPIISRLRGR